MPAPSESNAADLIRRRDRVVCPGVGRLSTLTAASARGAILTDADGREFIDFAGGIGVMNVGHTDPAVVAAINDQASRLLHTCIHVATYEPYVALCERLVELLPHHEPGSNDSTKAMLVNTGAEAVENSVKIARQATGRSAVICFTGAFHGRTLLAATLTSKVGYKAGCGPFMPEVYRLPFPVVRPNDDEAAVASRELARLRAALKNTVAPRDLAAIIVEPVQGEGGFHVLPPAYARGLRDICSEHAITLILDEVQTGFGRTGKWAAFEHLGIKPDLSPWAKSLGGGLPISCVIGKASVMDRVTPGTLGGTYGGNPVACAAALATIKRMQELDLNAKATRDGRTVRARFEAIAARVPAITDVRGLGAMLAIEFSVDADPERPDAPTVAAIINTCRDQGLLVIPAGVDSNAIRVLAPLVIDDATLARGLDILEAAILQHAAPTPAAPRPAHAPQGA